MNFHDEIDSDYLAMVELTKEISSIVQNSIDNRQDKLSDEDIDHVIKMTSDVIAKLKKQSVTLTVR